MEGFLNILFCFLQSVFRNNPVRCFLRRIMIDKYAIPETSYQGILIKFAKKSQTNAFFARTSLLSPAHGI